MVKGVEGSKGVLYFFGEATGWIGVFKLSTFKNVFNEFTVWFNIESQPDSMSQQYALEPPCLSAKVAVSTCPTALWLQLPLKWEHAPCLQQYLDLLRR